MPNNIPTRKDLGQKGKAYAKVRGNKKINPTQKLRRFTVLWVNNNGVPFNTGGFICTASTTNGVLLATTNFDSFGTAIFRSIGTPTTRTLVLRTYNANGVLFRTRRVPSGVAAYAIIG